MPRSSLKNSFVVGDLNLTNRQNLLIGICKQVKGRNYSPRPGGWGAFSGGECAYSRLLGVAQVRFNLLSAGFNQFSQAVDVGRCCQEESLQPSFGFAKVARVAQPM